MDLIVQKAVEIGAAEIAPLVSDRAHGSQFPRLIPANQGPNGPIPPILTPPAAALQNARSIFPENAASLALVMGCGFRVVGRREKIGCLDGVWRDTILVERRSRVVV